MSKFNRSTSTKIKRDLLLLLLVCLVITIATIYAIGGLDIAQIQNSLHQAGIWGVLGFVLLYVIATLLILPSTALNLLAGAMFGPWMGTLWASLAAVVASILAFWFARTIGRDWVKAKFADRWQALDAEMQTNGLWYILVIRLLPLIPYGIVSLVAGLTSLKLRDYSIGTTIGTTLGLFPFVWIGSSGVTAVKTGDLLPLWGACSLTALLMGISIWYRRRRSFPPAVQKHNSSQLSDRPNHKLKDPNP